MNKKFLKRLLFSLGIILFILVMSGPLLKAVGVDGLICITGEFPDIKFVPCENKKGEDTDLTTYPQPTLSEKPIPVIFDDDGSPDGMIALLYFLQNLNFEVKAVTISQGEAHPQIFAEHMAQFLAGLERADIPVGYGRETPLVGENSFPEPWRDGSDNFFGVQHAQSAFITNPKPAQDLILDTIANSPDPVMVFVSGPHTNIAETLRLNPELEKNILGVYIMGGNIYEPGNINHDWPEINNTVAEWNIWVDPVAAHQVFSSEIDLHLVPLDATNQIIWNKKDINRLKSAGTNEAIMVGNFMDVMINMSPAETIYIWDLVAAVVATNPNLCQGKKLALDVSTEPGPELGRIILLDESPNVNVCLEPEVNQIKNLVEDIFKKNK